ncbi:MAG: hypothetical protein IPN18_03750 [Ignavibacteriales bacterium]|jgi:phosphate/sulfate permease|nr:hypothetical protein [Ignavibacteriales bacterium]MBK8660951.1 hypothetical protein [Ignavibacteriales bacterium]MBP9124060.1 hypothetical protein [Ignavibacteriaceae bacterium]
MNSLRNKTILGGIVGTIVMTAFMYIAPSFGLPKMNPAEMISSMLGVPIVAGWVILFLVGIAVAFSYPDHFTKYSRQSNPLANGILFGLSIFIVVEIIIFAIAAIKGPMPTFDKAMILPMVGFLVAYILYGIAVALIVKNSKWYNYRH